GGRQPVTAWLYQALLTNKPYDEFARELLAPPDKRSSGFIDGIQWRGSVNASQTREVQFSQSISQTFLGLNMKCASCHDSFVDRWKLADAYGLAAIFAEQPIEMARCDKPTGLMTPTDLPPSSPSSRLKWPAATNPPASWPNPRGSSPNSARWTRRPPNRNA
ncbi:MAG: DUF1549 domain-containing protein, partial [Akkermansiaceae bacterium]|nr:DUF1549 domain-containing protein [Akkermansiaceae bacterium]